MLHKLIFLKLILGLKFQISWYMRLKLHHSYITWPKVDYKNFIWRMCNFHRSGHLFPLVFYAHTSHMNVVWPWDYGRGGCTVVSVHVYYVTNIQFHRPMPKVPSNKVLAFIQPYLYQWDPCMLCCDVFVCLSLSL